MKNFVQAGSNLTLTAPYAVASGGGVKIGSIFGVAAGDAASGATVDVVTFGVVELAKAATDVAAVGDALFWDDTAKLVTTDDDEGGNAKIGVAVVAAANPSGTARVRLNGVF